MLHLYVVIVAGIEQKDIKNNIHCRDPLQRSWTCCFVVSTLCVTRSISGQYVVLINLIALYLRFVTSR